MAYDSLYPYLSQARGLQPGVAAGYTLLHPDGAVLQARTTTGVVDLGDGRYMALFTLTTPIVIAVAWDDGVGGTDSEVVNLPALDSAGRMRPQPVSGPGDVPVDHNYGGADALAVRTATGEGVRGATVWAFLRSDYDAGMRGLGYVVASASTDLNGRWLAPMLLGQADYSLLVFKPGEFAPTVVNIRVDAD